VGAFNAIFYTNLTMKYNLRAHYLAYSCCWQGVRSDVVRWEAEQLALVRLGVANVRWA
jgi:hypothetical protein